MSLKHAILVLLDTEPGSGYDLMKYFKGSLGYFWNAKHQQVYHQLKQLTEQGFVRFEVREQSGRPDKKIYAITDKGLVELQSWLKDPAGVYKYNDALLVKLYGGKHLSERALLEELENHREIHEGILEELLAIEKSYLALDVKSKNKKRLPYITLRRGILGEQAWLEWANEAEQLIIDESK